MAAINYTTNDDSNIYTVTEYGVTYEMNFGYFSRLNRWVKIHQGINYSEESRAVYNWYREDLNNEERKNINVEGLDIDEDSGV